MKIWLPVALAATSFCLPLQANTDPAQDPFRQHDSVQETKQRMQEIRAQLRELEQELNAMQREKRQGQRVQLRDERGGQDRLPLAQRQRAPQRRAITSQHPRAGALFGGTAPQVQVELERLHGEHAQPRVRVQRSAAAPHESRPFFLGGQAFEHGGEEPHAFWQTDEPHGDGAKFEVHTEAFFIGADGQKIDLGSGGGLFSMAPQAGVPMGSCDCSCECSDSGPASGMPFGDFEWGTDVEYTTSFGTFTEPGFDGMAENTFLFSGPEGLSFGLMVDEEIVEECEVEEIMEEALLECELEAEPECELEAMSECSTEEMVVEYAMATDAFQAVHEDAMDAEIEALLFELEAEGHEVETIIVQGMGKPHKDMDAQIDAEIEALLFELEADGYEVETIVVQGMDKPHKGTNAQIDVEIDALIAELEGDGQMPHVIHTTTAPGDDIEMEIDALLAQLEGTAPKAKGGKLKSKQDALAMELETVIVEFEVPAVPAPAPAPATGAEQQRIAELEGEVEELRSLVDSLIKELNRQ